MARCLELAKLGEGNVAPNPLVGAVLVHKNRIIGEGYHKKLGEAHAEVNAFNSVLGSDKKLFTEAALYVNLEPCSHFGKTPPCVNLILENKIPKVVIAMLDPNPLVSGRGVSELKKKGVDVVIGVQEKKAKFLNRIFINYHVNKRPYVVLKWAQTKDGFIDRERKEGDSGVNWITSKKSQILVHQWRNEFSSILVGANTLRNDNPSLTVRHIEGKSPMRLVVSKYGNLSKSFNVFDGQVPTVVFAQKKEFNACNTHWELIDFSKNLVPQIMEYLYEENINSIFVEGGKKTLEYFISSGLWDEARIFTGDVYFKQGLKAPKIVGLEPSFEDFIGNDELRVYLNE